MASIERKCMLLDTGGPGNGPIFKLEFLVDGAPKSAEIKPCVELKGKYMEDPRLLLFEALEEIFGYKIDVKASGISESQHEGKGTITVVISSNGSRYQGRATFEDYIRILETYSDAYVNAVMQAELTVRSA